jgi:hypothetical protein
MLEEKPCPGCASVVYPREGLSRAARLWMLGGAMLTALVFLGGCIILLMLIPPVGALGRNTGPGILVVLWLFVSLIPGLLVGRMAKRFPMLIRGHWRQCGWRGQFPSV